MKAKELEQAVAPHSLVVWSGLNRKIQVGGDWEYFSLKEYPFLKQIYQDLASPEVRELCIMKSTQVGVTEGLLNLSWWFIDTKSGNVLYLMPSDSMLQDATRGRIDPSLQNSPQINDLFTVNNVQMKSGPKGNMYLRGTRSEEKLHEVPADVVIFDEYDQMTPRATELAEKRLSGSEFKWIVRASNPSFPGSPIHQAYQKSDRRNWTVTCEKCGEENKLDLWENFLKRKDQTLGCKNCGQDWTKDYIRSEGYWKSYNDHEKRGYQISQLISPHVSLEKLAKEWDRVKNSSGSAIETYYNHRAGLPFASESTSLTENKVRSLMTGKPENTELKGGTLGVDVGNVLHFWVQRANVCQGYGRVENFAELDQVIEKYGVESAVVDIAPETRKARQFIRRIQREYGVSGWLCRRSDRLEKPRLVDEENRTIKVRTTEHWSRWKAQFEGDNPLVLPQNLDQEAINALVSPVRTIEDTDQGKKSRWRKGDEAHYADASAYAREGLSRTVESSKPVFKGFEKQKHVITELPQLKPFMIGAWVTRQDQTAFVNAGMTADGKIYFTGERILDSSLPLMKKVDIFGQFLIDQKKEIPHTSTGSKYLTPEWIFAGGDDVKNFREKFYISDIDTRSPAIKDDPETEKYLSEANDLIDRGQLLLVDRCERLASELKSYNWSSSSIDPVLKSAALVIRAFKAKPGCRGRLNRGRKKKTEREWTNQDLIKEFDKQR